MVETCTFLVHFLYISCIFLVYFLYVIMHSIQNISDVKEASSFVYDASKTCTMLKETKLEVYLAIDTTSGIMMAQRGRIANQKFVVSSVRQPADNSKK